MNTAPNRGGTVRRLFLSDAVFMGCRAPRVPGAPGSWLLEFRAPQACGSSGSWRLRLLAPRIPGSSLTRGIGCASSCTGTFTGFDGLG